MSDEESGIISIIKYTYKAWKLSFETARLRDRGRMSDEERGVIC